MFSFFLFFFFNQYLRLVSSRHLRITLFYLENRLVVAKEEGEEVGWTGSLGSIDADYCIWSG